MSETTELSPFNESDFLAIEAAVLETDKGRWFLAEFARRNRVADTQTLLKALSRLERNLIAQPTSPLEEHPDIEALCAAIEETCSDINAVRNDMLEDKGVVPSGTTTFSHLSQSARQIAVDLISTAEALQGTVNQLRKSKAGAEADNIDGHVSSLFSDGWRQDVLAQRIAKAMGLLEHLDQGLKSLNATAQQAEPISVDELHQTLPQALTPECLKFFDGDEDLFEPDCEQKAEEPLSSSSTDDADQASATSPESVALQQREETAKETAIDDEPTNEETASSEPSDVEPQPFGSALEDPLPVVEPKVVMVRRGQSADINVTSESVSEPDPATNSNTTEIHEATNPNQPEKPDSVTETDEDKAVISEEQSVCEVNIAEKDEPEVSKTEASVGSYNAATIIVDERSGNLSELNAPPPTDTDPNDDLEPASEISNDSAESTQAITTDASPTAEESLVEAHKDSAMDDKDETAEELAGDESPIPTTSPAEATATSPFEQIAIPEPPQIPNIEIPNEMFDAEDKPTDPMAAFIDLASPVSAISSGKGSDPQEIGAEQGKERIVVIRRSSSEDAEIPFAEHLSSGSKEKPAEKVESVG